MEKDKGFVSNPSRQEDKDNNKKIESNADNITTIIIKHIHAALEAFNNQLKLSQNYAAGPLFTIADIILYNDIW